jgi:hypothetical protein
MAAIVEPEKIGALLRSIETDVRELFYLPSLVCLFDEARR